MDVKWILNVNLKRDQVDWRMPRDKPNPSLGKVIQKILLPKETLQEQPQNPPATSPAKES